MKRPRYELLILGRRTAYAVTCLFLGRTRNSHSRSRSREGVYRFRNRFDCQVKGRKVETDIQVYVFSDVKCYCVYSVFS